MNVLLTKLNSMIEQLSDQYADLSVDGGEQDKLTSPQQKRNRIKEEFKQQLQFTDLKAHLVSSILILLEECRQNSRKDEYKQLLSEFQKAGKKLREYDFMSVSSDDFQTILGISEASIALIFQIAIQKFVQEKYMDCLHLFVLVTTLSPKNPDYWFRLGIAAQQAELLELALKAYSIAERFDPGYIGARVFSVECYLKLGALEQAKAECAEAKQILEIQQNIEFSQLLTTLENLLKVA